MNDPYEQVDLGADSSGRPLIINRRTEAMLDVVEDRLGFELTIVQGSYAAGHAASASGHTHDEGGVVDLRTHDLSVDQREDALVELRRIGFAAWYRDADDGMDPHFHAVAIGDEQLHADAQAQAQAYLAGGDGLGGTDDGPQVDFEVFDYAAYLRGEYGTGASGDDFDIADGAPISATDRDKDGLTDEFEKLLGTSPTEADTDHDRLSDLEETTRSHTDPLVVNTDEDAAPDHVEVARGSDAGEVALPAAAVEAGFGGAGTLDRDRDDLSDLYEAQLGTDPTRADSDRDHVPDALEQAQGLDPTNIDTDADGLTDEWDAEAPA